MKILVISQVYWPDTASVSQHLSDLLESLASKNHNVLVITSKNNYENPSIQYAKNEVHNNVVIKRISNTSFGKRTKIGRVFDFLSFNVLIGLKLLFLKNNSFDLIIGLTAPPLLSYIGIKMALLKKIKFLYWTMDLQPELSIVSGYLNSSSRAAISLQKKGDFIFRKADVIITLDKYMIDHIKKRIGERQNIFSVPVWPVMSDIYTGSRLDNPFRIEHDFKDKIVVMYSGNHAVVHSLDTLIEVETRLKNDSRFLFVHIGSGIRLNDVAENKRINNLDNVILLPYQPREKIHLSLGSSDIQIVVLGKDCVGFTHPNKIYGAMYIGKPILYIGPHPSHITDVMGDIKGNIVVNHGDVDSLINKLEVFANLTLEEKNSIGELNRKVAVTEYSPKPLINKMCNIIASNY